MFTRTRALPLAAAIAWGLAHTTIASASMVTNAALSYEQTAAGRTGNGQGTLFTSLPAQAIYGSQFGPSTGDLAGAPGFSFYDDYIFTVSAATIDSVTSEIDLGSLSLGNLQERIYSLGNNTLPVLGSSTGFQTDWTTPISFQAGPSTGMTTVLGATQLAAGTYVLEIRGEVTGSSGGGYSGMLNLQPVPLPAALPMLLAGLGLLGGVARRRFIAGN